MKNYFFIHVHKGAEIQSHLSTQIFSSVTQMTMCMLRYVRTLHDSAYNPPMEMALRQFCQGLDPRALWEESFHWQQVTNGLETREAQLPLVIAWRLFIKVFMDPGV
jgi:hypothetical protein